MPSKKLTDVGATVFDPLLPTDLVYVVRGTQWGRSTVDALPSVGDLAWTALTLNSGWTNPGGPTPSWADDGRFLYFRGAVIFSSEVAPTTLAGGPSPFVMPVALDADKTAMGIGFQNDFNTPTEVAWYYTSSSNIIKCLPTRLGTRLFGLDTLRFYKAT